MIDECPLVLDRRNFKMMIGKEGGL
jgi:hypothetical protein